MAIPVENAPRPYEPARASAGAPAAEGKALPPGAPVDPTRAPLPPGLRVYRARIGWQGCLVAVAVTIGLLFAVGGFGTCAVSDVVLVEAPRNVALSIREAARAQGRESEVDEDLRRLSYLIESRQLGLFSAGVLLNRHLDAKADQVISPEEIERLMALVHDIVVGGGYVDPEAYPEGR